MKRFAVFKKQLFLLLLLGATFFGVNAQEALPGGHLLMPAEAPQKGLVVLLPSFGETPEKLLQNTSLPKQLTEAGYNCILFYPPQEGRYMGFDTLSQQKLDSLLKWLHETPRIQNKKAFPRWIFHWWHLRREVCSTCRGR